MKKALLFICFLFTLSMGNAQDGVLLELEHNPANVMEPNKDNTDVIAETVVKNTGIGELETTWTRTSIELPEGWVTYICDAKNCYPPNTFTGKFTLAASQSGPFSCHVNPNGICGSGVIKVEFAESEDLKQEGIFNFTVCTTANGDIETQSIGLFPNPTNGTFKIETTNVELGRIDIYNVLGRKVQSYEGSNRFFDISNEAMGIYLVQMVGIDNDVIKTMRVSKVNP